MSGFATQKMNEGIAIPEAGLEPANQAAATVTSAGVDSSRFERLRYVVGVGTPGSGGTVNAKLRASKTSDLASPSDITGAALVAVTAAGWFVIELHVPDLETLLPGYRYVYISLTVGVATTPICALCEGCPSFAKPGSQFNDASVGQLVSVP